MTMTMVRDGRPAVLVIDDERGMREMLEYELGMEGFDVTSADSGRTALEAMRRRKFDLAVTDLKMPGMDGCATLAALRAMDPGIEVIVATGHATVETAVACMKNGAFDYIQKPFDPLELRLLLERAMERSHLHGVVALYEASRTLLATLRRGELTGAALDLARRVLDADGAALVAGPTMEGATLHEAPDSPIGESRARAAARVAEALGRPVRLPEDAPHGVDAGPGSALAYPLVARDRALGWMVVARSGDRVPFAPSELQRGSVLAGQVALSMDNARLYSDLADRLDELVAMRDRGARAERLSAVTHMAGCVAHEIGNPLTVLHANLAAIREASRALGSGGALEAATVAPRAGVAPVMADAPGGQAVVEELELLVSEMLSCVQRITGLVSGFRRLSRVAEGLPPVPVELGGLLRSCTAARGGARDVALSAPARVVAMAADDDVHTIVANVLDFLCARVPPGTEAPPVRVFCAAHDAVAVVAFRDPWLRLTDEGRRALLDVRLEDGAHVGTVRLDLGLAMAHHLALRNGGALDVVPSEDGGTSLVLELPRAVS